ncbi:MAG: hypothetical protein KME42_02770 [Tildeniella nuda ZEHNDER 1965/U140]|nr:hypothetical protein [Tildeniella nuda ZEHNDER 1965/U140]
MIATETHCALQSRSLTGRLEGGLLAASAPDAASLNQCVSDEKMLIDLA